MAVIAASSPTWTLAGTETPESAGGVTSSTATAISIAPASKAQAEIASPAASMATRGSPNAGWEPSEIVTGLGKAPAAGRETASAAVPTRQTTVDPPASEPATSGSVPMFNPAGPPSVR